MVGLRRRFPTQKIPEFNEPRPELREGILGAIRKRQFGRSRGLVVRLTTVLSELLTRALNREFLVPKQVSDLLHDLDVAFLVGSVPGPASSWPQHREFLLPKTKDVRFDSGQLGNLTNRIVNLLKTFWRHDFLTFA